MACLWTNHEHDERQPNVLIGGNRNGVLCHKCGEFHTVVELVMQHLSLDKQEAIAWLEETFGVGGRAAQSPVPRDPVEQWARLRGVRPESVRVIGVEVECGNGCPELRSPMRTAGGDVTGRRRRRADNKPFPPTPNRSEPTKTLTNRGGRNGLLYPAPFPPDDSRPALLVEGEGNAVAALNAGWPRVVGMPSATPGSHAWSGAQKLLAGSEVVMTPDPGEAGCKWRDKAGGTLADAGCTVRFAPPTGDMDLADRLRKSSDPGAELARLAAEAVPWQERSASLPVVQLDDRPLPERTGDVLNALVMANDPPVLFTRTGALARVVRDEKGRHLIDRVRDDAQAAAERLLEVIVDFPFDSDASRANALAMMLTPLLRPAIDGLVPLAAVDAPKQGSGKTLLVDAAVTIATGSGAPMMGAARNDDDSEWDKRITALLREGTTIVVVDNVEGTVKAPSLCRALTCHEWRGRVLGASQMVRLPQRAVWFMTGNNLSLAGDLPRRCFWVRLDPKTARPEKRTGFCHPDLLGWVVANRGQLLTALLTLPRAWFANGKPPAEHVPTFGSFEEWTDTMAGILDFAGVQGFLANQDDFREKQNEDEQEWEAFLWELSAEFGTVNFRVAGVIHELGSSARRGRARVRQPDRDPRGRVRRQARAQGHRSPR